MKAAKDFSIKKRVIAKCPHGRQRSFCKECGGSQICEHGRQRSICKECNTPERYKKVRAQKRAANHKHRAHIYHNGGSWTAAEFTAMCAQYDHRCACCGKKCESLHADHILCVTKGGKNVSAICNRSVCHATPARTQRRVLIRASAADIMKMCQ